MTTYILPVPTYLVLSSIMNLQKFNFRFYKFYQIFFKKKSNVTLRNSISSSYNSSSCFFKFSHSFSNDTNFCSNSFFVGLEYNALYNAVAPIHAHVNSKKTVDQAAEKQHRFATPNAPVTFKILNKNANLDKEFSLRHAK